MSSWSTTCPSASPSPPSFSRSNSPPRKGLFVNSTDLCQAKHRAKANAVGQNGKRIVLKPLVRAQCGKTKHKKRKQSRVHRGDQNHHGATRQEAR